MAAGSTFINRYQLYSEVQKAAAEQSLARVKEQNIEVIRLTWPDQYGVLRGRSITAEAYASALHNGLEITMAPFCFDTANAIVT